MPDGVEMLDNASFEARIKSMSDRELSEFTARQLFDHCQKEILVNKKVSGVTGGISGAVAGIAIGLVEYFTRK